MQLGVWKVSPDKGKAVEPIQQGFHRAAGGEAERTPEVSVFDQGQAGRVGASDVVAVCDRRQRAGQVGHLCLVTTVGLDHGFEQITHEEPPSDGGVELLDLVGGELDQGRTHVVLEVRDGRSAGDRQQNG